MPVGRCTRYAGGVLYTSTAAAMQTAWKCMANIQADRACDLDMHENQIPDITASCGLTHPPHSTHADIFCISHPIPHPSPPHPTSPKHPEPGNPGIDSQPICRTDPPEPVF